MKKYRELLNNIGLLTLSNFGSKLLGFLLVPLYTSVLTTEEYGNYDFITVTISLLVPILTLNISDAALRFLLDDKKNKKDVCNIALRINFISILIFMILAMLNNIFNIIKILNNYFSYFIIFYIITVLYQYFQNVIRGLNKVKILAVSGIINSIFMLGLNIFFLLVLKIGLSGYFLANIIANVIATLYLFIKSNINENINIFNKTDKDVQIEMINYSKPLMLNSIGWWINNVSDRYIITYMCGVAANGIYSVSYKIPSILSIIQTIFNQAWGISAIKEFDKEDEDNFFKYIYSSYNIIMIICCSILILFTKILAKILYSNEFYAAWKYMPFLMVSIVFSALSGLLGGIFSAVKDTKTLGITTVLGALLNIILNIILIKFIGVIGAAIATAFSIFFVWIIRIFKVRKYIKLNFNFGKDMLAYGILIIQAIIFLLIKDNLILYSMQIILFVMELILYYSQIKRILNLFKEKIKKRRRI